MRYEIIFAPGMDGCPDLLCKCTKKDTWVPKEALMWNVEPKAEWKNEDGTVTTLWRGNTFMMSRSEHGWT